MKKILLMALVAMMPAVLSSFAGGRMHDGDVNASGQDAGEDSAVAVIAWFEKSDTVTYWIGEAEWKVKDNDTVQTIGVNTKVMLTVTDSTKKGYDMEYRFLEFSTDSLPESKGAAFMNSVMDKWGPKLVGTAIRFHTDEYGKIEKYYNLKEIKKQAKALYKDVWAELMRLPEMDSLKNMGVDMSRLLKKVDTDELVQGYIEDLEQMFTYHGIEFKTGRQTLHNDATADEYASDTRMLVECDTVTGEYGIYVDVDSYVPAEDIVVLTAAIVESFIGNEQSEELSRELGNYVKEPVVFNTYLSIEYFPNGWPKNLLSQKSRVIMNRGKLKQKSITWDSRNFRLAAE